MRNKEYYYKKYKREQKIDKILDITLVVFIMLIVSLALLPLVNAATDTQNIDDTFKINEVINYNKACFNNGSYCSAAATCNFTIFNPDNTILFNNKLATNQGSYHNISFSVTKYGIYQADMTCVDGGLKGAETLYFEVTGDGFNSTIGFYIVILLLCFLIMGLGFWLVDPPMVILGSFALLFFGLYIILYGIVGIKDLITTWAIGLIVTSLASYIGIKSGFELVSNAD